MVAGGNTLMLRRGCVTGSLEAEDRQERKNWCLWRSFYQSYCSHPLPHLHHLCGTPICPGSPRWWSPQGLPHRPCESRGCWNTVYHRRHWNLPGKRVVRRQTWQIRVSHITFYTLQNPFWPPGENSRVILPVLRSLPGRPGSPHCWHACLLSKWCYCTGKWWKRALRLLWAPLEKYLPAKRRTHSVQQFPGSKKV